MSTEELLNVTKDLSVHQLGALRTLVMVKKILLNNKPSYLAERLQPEQSKGRCGSVIDLGASKLEIQKQGFVYRGGNLYNQLPLELREQPSIPKFKNEVRKWVKEKVSTRP